MIGKGKACAGGAALADYVMKPEKGYELIRNGVCGDTPSELLQEMKIIQDLNQRARNKTFSLVLSPEKKEGQTLSDDTLSDLTTDFMKGLGIDPSEQQFVAWVHTEKEHKHIHIIANRVNTEGKLLSDHNIGKRAQWEAHKVAKKYGLISAKEKQIENLTKKVEADKNLKGIKLNIKRKHDWVMKQKPVSIQSYSRLMGKMGVEVNLIENKFSGKVQGLRVKDLNSKQEFKSSEIHRSMSLNQIMRTGMSLEEPAHSEVAKDKNNEVFKQNKAHNINQQMEMERFLRRLKTVTSYEERNDLKKKKKKPKYLTR